MRKAYVSSAFLLTNVIFGLLLLLAGCSDPCDEVNCLNGGTCADGTCVCPEGFTGVSCETAVVIDPCADVNCLNGGTCNDGTCACPEGFTGTFCETATEPTDPCEGLNCGSNGNCVVVEGNGTCLCDPGYEGTFCDSLSRDKFLGTYNASEACTSGLDNYAFTVTADVSGIDAVSISNLYNLGLTVVGTVSGSILTIPSQTVGNVTFIGSGSMQGDTLFLSFTVSADGISDTCTTTGLKQ
jgi:hypothetical protein